MTPTTREWVEKAERDFASASREMRARKTPNYDLACFCAQQCAEKYMKAVLQQLGRPIPRTHDLIKLLDLLGANFLELGLLHARLDALTPYAVHFRYPGESATKVLAKRACQDCTATREAVRLLLGLSASKNTARQASTRTARKPASSRNRRKGSST
ncbi:MAG: HEPN domain-containing protein [Planctomycetota bacterium]